MEDLLEEIAEEGLVDPRYHALLSALRPPRRGARPALTLPELLKAKNEGRLKQLAAALQDPVLTDAIAEFLKVNTGYENEHAMDMVKAYAPAKVGGKPTRLTYLRSSKHIMLMLGAAEASGLKRNSVIRYLWTGISKLLRFHLGRAARNEIFADVQYAKEDDARSVNLSPDEIARLLGACAEIDAEMGVGSRAASGVCEGFFEMIRLALVTGGDRAPLLRLCVRDVRIVEADDHLRGTALRGTVFLLDKKADARPRTVAITDGMCRLLWPLVAGRDGADALFRITKRQLQTRWEAARARAGLPALRFKDLRHRFGVAASRSKLPIAQIQNAMGHKRRETSLIYTQHDVSLDIEAAWRVEREMGLLPPAAPASGEAG